MILELLLDAMRVDALVAQVEEGPPALHVADEEESTLVRRGGCFVFAGRSIAYP